MKADQTRSLRLNELRKLALRLASNGEAPEDKVLAIKYKITQWGVSKSTGNNYFDTVARQLGN